MSLFTWDACGRQPTQSNSFIHMTLKNKRKNRMYPKMQFNWLIEQNKRARMFIGFSEHGCKQRRFSKELSGMRSAFRFDVIRNAVT